MSKGSEGDVDIAAPASGHLEPSTEALSNAVRDSVKHIRNIYEALPRCTAFIVYSGISDPRELTRLHAKLRRYREEFKTKKWDELGDLQWMDADEQAL